MAANATGVTGPHDVPLTIVDDDALEPPTSGPPTVAATCNPCVVAPGGAVELTATASDPHGDPLTHAWSGDSGSFISATDGTTAHWTAPGATGLVTVHVQTLDGRSDTAKAAGWRRAAWRASAPGPARRRAGRFGPLAPPPQDVRSPRPSAIVVE